MRLMFWAVLACVAASDFTADLVLSALPEHLNWICGFVATVCYKSCVFTTCAKISALIETVVSLLQVRTFKFFFLPMINLL